jgi:hypothetical protein
MRLFISLGLFRPYGNLKGDDPPANMLVPLVVLLGAAVACSAPIFQVKGAWLAAGYTLVSFLVLCFLRRKVLDAAAYEIGNRLYISPSAYSLAEMTALFYPSILWVCISFGGAYLMWGWKLAE